MNRKEALESLIDKVSKLMRSFANTHSFPFGELKLSRSQMGVLFVIARHKEGVAVKELAQFLDVTSGAITQIIDGLIEKGLVQRSEDPEDRRSLRITLTEQAQAQFTAIKKEYYNGMAARFQDLTDDEINQFIILVDKMNTTADTNKDN